MSDDNKSGRVVVKKKQKKQHLGTFVKGVLRRASFQWKARNEALVLSRVSRGKYKCASCEELFGPNQVEIDHVYPVIDPKVGFTTFDDYINRLFCPVEDYQILCKACHEVKTLQEDFMREHYKTEREVLPDLTKHKKELAKKAEEEV